MTAMDTGSFRVHRYRDTDTTSREARAAVDARVATLEHTLGAIRAAEELVVRPDHTTEEEVAAIVARLRNLEATVSLEDLDR